MDEELFIWHVIESLLGKSALTALDDPDDNSKKPQSTSKNLYDKNFYEGIRILSICNRTSTSRYSNANSNLFNILPAKQIRKSNWNTRPE